MVQKKLLLITLVLGGLVSAVSLSATPKNLSDVSVEDVVQEVTRVYRDGQQMTGVCWLPQEVFQVLLVTDPILTQRYTEGTFKDYCVLLVSRAKINVDRQCEYLTRAQLDEGLTVTFVSTDGQEYILQRVQEVDPVAEHFLALVAPTLASGMGDVLRHFSFFVFSDADGNGRRIVSPYRGGQLRVNFAATGGLPAVAVEFDTLLDSLHVPRICPICQKPMHVSWKFCPWCGKAIPGN